MINKLNFDQIKSARPDLSSLSEMNRFPVSVVAENIRSLYNVGSVFRTSDGALVEKLWLSGYTGFPPRKEIDKTALGSVESVPWEHCSEPESVIERIKGEGKRIVCLEHTDSSVPYNEADYEFPMCLLIGNEVGGLSDEAVSMCDMAIEIPMHGIKQSLNVSVAYGIVIYHIIEEFKRKNPEWERIIHQKV